MPGAAVECEAARSRRSRALASGEEAALRCIRCKPRSRDLGDRANAALHPRILMTAKALLEKEKNPSRKE